MKVGNQIFIAPCSNARQRTKNRIREHGAGGFKVRDSVEHCDCLNGDPGVLLVASDGWLGWLRTDEIKILDTSNNLI